jgi:hypothetical protein
VLKFLNNISAFKKRLTGGFAQSHIQTVELEYLHAESKTFIHNAGSRFVDSYRRRIRPFIYARTPLSFREKIPAPLHVNRDGSAPACSSGAGSGDYPFSRDGAKDSQRVPLFYVMNPVSTSNGSDWFD